MKQSSLSMLTFGIYLTCLALLLVFYPRFFLLLGFDDVSGPWVRVLGYVVGVLAFFYFMAVREQITTFYRWTIYGRLPLLFFATVLVALDLAPPIMLLIGALDATGALWTAWALRRERTP